MLDGRASRLVCDGSAGVENVVEVERADVVGSGMSAREMMEGSELGRKVDGSSMSGSESESDSSSTRAWDIFPWNMTPDRTAVVDVLINWADSVSWHQQSWAVVRLDSLSSLGIVCTICKWSCKAEAQEERELHEW